MIKMFKDVIKDFEKIFPIPYLEQGILTSEAFFIYAFAKLYDIDIMIDSGTHLGRSAEIFAKLGFAVHTIDRQASTDTQIRLNQYNNITQYIGEDHDYIPKILDSILDNSRIGLYMDSTKGRSACIFCKELTDKYKSIKIVAIHDQWRQHLMKKYFSKTKYSDEEPFSSKYWYLNNQKFNDTKTELNYIKIKYAEDFKWEDFKGFVVGVTPT